MQPSNNAVRILTVSDVVDPLLYDHFDAARWRAAGVDLLVSCGDLPPDYLTYLASRFKRPLFYVLGNHDCSYHYTPPEGCQSIDGRLVRWNGLRILGLGGAPWQNGGSEQYRESAMALRLLLLKPRLWRLGGLDLVVTHAPPRLVVPAAPGRQEAAVPASLDPGHRGFRTFTKLLRAYRPRALVHGHTHIAYGATDRDVEVWGTRIVAAYGHYVLDL